MVNVFGLLCKVVLNQLSIVNRRWSMVNRLTISQDLRSPREQKGKAKNKKQKLFILSGVIYGEIKD